MGKISGKPLLLPSTLPVSYKFSCKRIDQEQWSITKHHESTKKRDPNKHRLTKLFHVASQHTGWWFQPLWKILVSWDHYSQYMESHKIYVPNHQPAYIYYLSWEPQMYWCHDSAVWKLAQHLNRIWIAAAWYKRWNVPGWNLGIYNVCIVYKYISGWIIIFH